MTAKTPVYGLEYLVQGEPARNTRLALENNAKTIEAALVARGVPPTDLQDLIAGGWFSDSGWVGIVSAAGTTLNGSPQVRKVGKLVKAQAGWSSATIPGGAGAMQPNTNYYVAAAGGIPAGFRPSYTLYLRAGTNSAANPGRFVIGTDGSIQLHVGAVVSSYYRLDTCDWFLG